MSYFRLSKGRLGNTGQSVDMVDDAGELFGTIVLEGKEVKIVSEQITNVGGSTEMKMLSAS